MSKIDLFNPMRFSVTDSAKPNYIKIIFISVPMMPIWTALNFARFTRFWSDQFSTSNSVFVFRPKFSFFTLFVSKFHKVMLFPKSFIDFSVSSSLFFKKYRVVISFCSVVISHFGKNFFSIFQIVVVLPFKSFLSMFNVIFMSEFFQFFFCIHRLIIPK